MGLDAINFEKQVMQQADHQSIIKLLDFYEDDKYFSFVTDLMSQDLREMICEMDYAQVMEEQTVKIIFGQMLSSINHIHEMNLIHRDIKLENFLIGNDMHDIKLIDFGLTVEYDKKNKPKDVCGSIMTMAPEIYNEIGYD